LIGKSAVADGVDAVVFGGADIAYCACCMRRQIYPRIVRAAYYGKKGIKKILQEIAVEWHVLVLRQSYDGQ
jgi:hypothetical protein